ncbi:PREDICTED: bifunctional ATP-dependent dihydroxyacetone kinase/FAD-AMP lyase (cyclizing)-like [Ceratosolen solmsi marchali]|uniref:Triokinase/FMN cyclase n=1 Tax=Ceratosolen solmsi marchali TaxID=326594 RepID=A0AAJ7DV60_9HYME|nr:PREDICTED: bifunctional ATP-dependent dihydroxyacetone kinase/FAD-AMP lyase (cyclizing)-like [Ceratosolen solmsi marchali]
MAKKSLINSIDGMVNESLIGYTLAYPQLELHSPRVVLKAGWNELDNKVAIVSGGGSGHEPFSAGFVGAGMLSASISGSVFASPPSGHVLHAIKCASANNNNAGCLVIIANYTGDCLNFGLAIEKALGQGLKVVQVTVGDDCSIPDNELGKVGKRALPGIILVIKIAGAMAQNGYSIDEVAKNAQLIANNTASCSIGLTACKIPGEGPMFELPDDEIEFGQGIHGEAGYKRIKLQPVSKIVSLMINVIIKSLKIVKRDSVVILINNFGGLSQLEQGIVVKEVVTQLQKMEIIPVRVYSGLLMTSLDSAGVHLSILKLPENDIKSILYFLDEKTEAPGWPGCSYSIALSNHQDIMIVQEKMSQMKVGPSLNNYQEQLLRACLQKSCKAIIEKERSINELDSGCGDGDCGTTLKNLGEGVLAAIDKLIVSHPSSLMSELANIAEERMGGTSGALYSLMFTAAGSALSNSDNTESWLEIWARAWRAGINGIMKYSKAVPGDKTMIDVLYPSLNELEKDLTLPYKKAAVQVAKVATKSAEETKNMIPKIGRASYVKQGEYLKNIDAGAFAVSIWINSITECL